MFSPFPGILLRVQLPTLGERRRLQYARDFPTRFWTRCPILVSVRHGYTQGGLLYTDVGSLILFQSVDGFLAGERILCCHKGRM